MYLKGVSSVLDYSVEGKENEEEFDSAMQKVLKIIDFAHEKESMPIAVFKPTGFGRFYLYEKLGNGKTINTEEQEEWNRVVEKNIFNKETLNDSYKYTESEAEKVYRSFEDQFKLFGYPEDSWKYL